VLQAAAWSVPAVTVVSAAPAFAASDDARTAFVVDQDGGYVAKSGQLLLSLTPAPAQPMLTKDFVGSYTGGATTISFQQLSTSGTGTASSALYRLTFVVPDSTESVTVNGVVTNYGPIAPTTVTLRKSGLHDGSFAVGSGPLSPSPAGPGGEVNAIAVDGSGRVVVGGAFGEYNGRRATNVVRLGDDGTRDTTLTGNDNPVNGPNGAVYAIAIDASGRLLLGGAFDRYAGILTQRYIVRLQSNGVRDTTFATGSAFSAEVRAIAIQPDGKIVVGGLFDTYDGDDAHRVVRLTASGAKDPSFAAGGFDGVVNALAVLPDGKILVAGTPFSGPGHSAGSPVVRLLPGGSPDPTFGSGVGLNGRVNALAVQPDGKIVAGGAFSMFNGTGRTGIARLNADGTLDETFVPPTLQGPLSTEGLVRSVAALPDGRVLAGGQFVDADGAPVGRIVGLRANGAVDTTFASQAGGGFDGNVLVLTPHGSRVLAGGTFGGHAGSSSSRLARFEG
jgi:uncharacterized delta-60 repeat protein